MGDSAPTNDLNHPGDGEPGIEIALSEMGPNPITEFADAVEVEGVDKPGPEFFREWERRGGFRDALIEFLQDKNHAVIGGIAARIYGARPGPTFDFDLLVGREILHGITKFLESQGAELMRTDPDIYFFHLKSAHVWIDVCVATSPLEVEALSSAKAAKYQGRRLRIVAPVHLAAMKVKACAERPKRPALPWQTKAKQELDREDVRGLIHLQKTEPDAVRDVLRKHQPDLVPVFEGILADAV